MRTKFQADHTPSTATFRQKNAFGFHFTDKSGNFGRLSDPAALKKHAIAGTRLRKLAQCGLDRRVGYSVQTLAQNMRGAHRQGEPPSP